MTKLKAKQILQQAQDLIFEVESKMDIEKSEVRRIGYRTRIQLGKFMDSIRYAKSENVEDIV